MKPQKTPQPTGQAPALQFVKLTDIMPDPNQPRKHFSEVDDKDLLESVKSQGILQAILVRPLESSESLWKKAGQAGPSAKYTKYLIVCGERRFRAAAAVLAQDPSWQAGLIPCQVKSMNDEAALEAQIVENLQRKDVHPLEEAMAFESLINRGLTQEQIGARVGKGDRFVRARLVLCQLTEAWRDIFLRGKIDLELALKICRFPSAVQKQILEDQGLKKGDLDRPEFRLYISDFSPYRGDLKTAPFDTTDASLVKARGACTGCPFNSASGSLFPDDSARPRCTDLPCYRKKTEVSFEARIKQAKEDPSLVLVKRGYRAQDDKVVQRLKADGLTVYDFAHYERYGLYEKDPGSFEDWKGLREYYPSDKEAEIYQTWERKVRDFNESQEKIRKGLKNGSVKRALVVQGDDEEPAGSIIYVRIRPKSETSSGPSRKGADGKTPAQRIAEGKVNKSDLEAEIARLGKDIEDTQKRAGDQAHVELIKSYKENPASNKDTGLDLSEIERRILLIYLLGKLGGLDKIISDGSDNAEDMKGDQDFAEALGFTFKRDKKGNKLAGELSSMDLVDPKDRPRIWDFVAKLSDVQLALIFRRVILVTYGNTNRQLPSDQYNNSDAWLMRKAIEAVLNPAEILRHETEAKERVSKRIQRAKDRIKDLKAQLKTLETKKAAKPATKAPAPKKKK